MEEENEINPPKGLVSGFSKPSTTSKFSDLAKQYSNNLYYNTGFGQSSYDKNFNFDAQFNENDPQGSINENRAEQQGWATQLGAGTLRAGAKALTEIAKLPGIVAGAIAAPFVKDGEGFDTIFNNEWVKGLDQINNTINTEALPVYAKKAVTDGNLWDNITSTSFWATDGADGVGYMLAMMAPGAILSETGVGANLIANTAKAAKYAGMAESLEGATQALSKVGLTGRTLDVGLNATANTIFEAGAEAKGVGDDLDIRKDEFINTHIMNGMSPELADQTFKEQRAQAMADTFKSNLAILIGPNLLMSKAIWGEAADKFVAETTESGIKQRIGNWGKRWGEAFLSEGLVEEASQTTIENTFTNKAMKNELGKGNDFNIGELTENYFNTLSTTEGAKAVFLGGMMGGPFMSYTGRQEDVHNKNISNEILNNVNQSINSFNTSIGNDIYKKGEDGNDVYKRNSKGQFTSEREIDPIKVIEVAKSLSFNEEESAHLDEAIQNGDESVVKEIKQRAIFDMILPAVHNDKAGLQALEQQLNKSTEFQDIINKDDNKEFVKQTLEVAKYLQSQNENFKNFGKDVINLDNKDALAEDKQDYLNRLNNQYLNVKYNQYNSEKLLKELQDKKSKLVEELNLQPQTDPTFTVDEFINNNKNPLLERLDNNIEQVEKSIAKNKKDIAEVWSGKDKIDKSFDKFIKDRNKLREQTSPENIVKAEAAITQITNAKKEEDLNNLPKTNTTTDQVIEQKKEAKRQEIIETENTQLNNERVQAIENEIEQPVDLNQYEPVNEFYIDKGTELYERNDSEAEHFTGQKYGLFGKVKNWKVVGGELKGLLLDVNGKNIWLNNGEWNKYFTKKEIKSNSSYSDIVATEGSNISDDIIPLNDSNNSLEELKTVQTGDVDNGKGVKVISTDKSTGEPLKFIAEQFPNYLAYEREPVNKTGREVSFEINQNPGTNPKLLKALELFNKGDYSDLGYLIKYLPINVKFTNEVKAPIETERINGEIDPSTELLRIDILNQLFKGMPLEKIKGSIQGQYKGLLKVTPEYSENNILDLDGVKDINYVRNNLWVVNGQGQLQNIITDDISNFQNVFSKDLDRVKNNAKGEIYLTIPQANGQMFPLKLNIKKLSLEEAGLIYELYREILTNDKSFNTTIGELGPMLESQIKTNFESELKIIGGTVNDIKLQELIDLLIYNNSRNSKSQMRIENGVLYFGNRVADKESIDEHTHIILDYLVNNKRHQIKIGPKSETDNTKTNLKSNSADYLKYLLDNKILSTNAVVNEPTFQGYTNIYLNPTITINSDFKTIKNLKEKLSKVQSVEQLEEEYNKLSDKQKEIYSDLFDDRWNELSNQPKVEVSEEGVKIDSKGFEGLNFGEVQADSGADFIQNFNEDNIDNLPFGMSEEAEKVLNNIRNSQENFVSLSEIPGTTENTELNKTQSEVFKAKTNPKDRAQDIRRMGILLRKESEGTLNKSNEITDLESFKQAYSNEYKKTCK